MTGPVISRRTFLTGAAALAAFSALPGLAGCAKAPGGPSSSSAGAASRLVVGATAEPDTFDLTQSAVAAIPQLLLYNVYETLVRVDSTGAIRPLLASAYAVSPDGLTYTFTLEPKARFASGTPVTADAVVASIDRMRQARNGTLKDQMAVVTDARADGDGTVVVTLSRPSNLWLFNLTQTAGIVFDPAIADLATAPMGSGPFQVDDWVHGDHIDLARNENYWGTPGRFDTVTFRYIADPNALVSAELSGEVDIISDLTSPDALSRFTDTSRFTIIDGTTNGEVVLGFNHASPALADKLVRQAICHGIDRKALLDTVWSGKGTLIGSMVPPTDPWYEDLSHTYPYDPALARSLLSQAGYGNGLTLRLRVPTLPYAPPAAQFIASQLTKVGITCQVEELDFGGRWITEVYTNHNYDMTIVNHVEPRDIVQFADPTYYWQYNNPAFQQLIKQADGSPDQATFIADMKQAAKLLADDAAADWLFLFPNLVVTKANITGVAQNATSLSFDLTTIAAG